jgi:hypothetical protein
LPPYYIQNLIADSHGYKDHSGLVVEPAEAAKVFGEDVASKLKTNKHGNLILYPQPTDDPNDPQNVSAATFGTALYISRMPLTRSFYSGQVARRL